MQVTLDSPSSNSTCAAMTAPQASGEVAELLEALKLSKDELTKRVSSSVGESKTPEEASQLVRDAKALLEIEENGLAAFRLAKIESFVEQGGSIKDALEAVEQFCPEHKSHFLKETILNYGVRNRVRISELLAVLDADGRTELFEVLRSLVESGDFLRMHDRGGDLIYALTSAPEFRAEFFKDLISNPSRDVWEPVFDAIGFRGSRDPVAASLLKNLVYDESIDVSKRSRGLYFLMCDRQRAKSEIKTLMTSDLHPELKEQAFKEFRDWQAIASPEFKWFRDAVVDVLKSDNKELKEHSVKDGYLYANKSFRKQIFGSAPAHEGVKATFLLLAAGVAGLWGGVALGLGFAAASAYQFIKGLRKNWGLSDPDPKIAVALWKTLNDRS